MKSDLRFLISMNVGMVGFALLVTGKALVFKSPEPDFTRLMERVKTSENIGQAVEHAGFIAKIAHKRAERIKEEKQMVAILGAFSAFIAGMNLCFFVHFYKKSKKGIWLQDGAELEKT
jgi:hypothetical protein